MARYYASAGIRYSQGPTDKPDAYPFIVIIGPSGQAGQVHGPSGLANPIIYEAYEQTSNHKCLAFYKNEILISLRDAIGTLRANYGMAWMPYGMPAGQKKNPALDSIEDEDGYSIANRVMMDGFKFKCCLPVMLDWYKEHFAYYKMPGGKLFWCFPTMQETLTYGFYDGKNPTWTISGSTSGYRTHSGIYFGRNFQTAADMLDSIRYGGVHRDLDTVGTGPSSSVNDIIYYKGTIYIAFEDKIIGIVPGGKGNFVWHNKVDDSEVSEDSSLTSNYISRSSNNLYGGSQNRCFAIHNNTLYMLQADGKLFEVNAGGIKQIKDLAALGTPWSSGIYGGYTQEASQTSWPGSTGFRCFMVSFNKQLHAFLNFRTTWDVAKGTDGAAGGRGIFWATSHDGVKWSDRSNKLPGSGIHPTSGTLPIWLGTINPYKFSGRTGYNRSQYTVWQASASGKVLKFAACRPSGFRQHKMIPWVSTSGTMIDGEYTAFGSLHCPLNRGAISGYLFPTWIQYPLYHILGGQFRPYSHGPSGYDYTGCHNWHISGHTDEVNKKLRLMFSEDFHGAGVWGATLFYDLSESSGWNRVNYLAKSNQLNGLVPIDLYDPEVLIPSGDLYNPNPRINEISKQLTLDYYLYDWPHWSLVTTRMEYSIDDGQSWHYAGGQRSLSTGSKATDPSGVNGVKHTWTWNYADYLNHNTDYNRIQLRVRAQED